MAANPDEEPQLQTRADQSVRERLGDLTEDYLGIALLISLLTRLWNFIKWLAQCLRSVWNFIEEAVTDGEHALEIIKSLIRFVVLAAVVALAARLIGLTFINSIDPNSILATYHDGIFIEFLHILHYVSPTLLLLYDIAKFCRNLATNWSNR